MTNLDQHRPDRDLLDRLERHLDRAGAEVGMRPSSVSAAIGRARRRQRRRNVAVASGTLALVVAAVTTVAVVQRPVTTPADVDRPGVTTSDTTPITTSPAPTPPPTTSPATSDVGTATTVATDETNPTDPAPSATAAALIAPDGADPSAWQFGANIAWTPAEEGLASDVFVSDDGVTWRSLTIDPPLQVWGGARDATGTVRLVGIPVGDAAGAAPALFVGSGDVVDSWTSIDLPIDLDPADGARALGFAASVASRDDATVVGVTDSGYRRWLLTVLDDGTVIDAADTGLDLGDQLPMDEATRFLSTVIADEQGFVAVGGFSSDVTTLTYWTSPDGLTWSATGTTEQPVGLIGRIGTTLVATAAPLSTSLDGSTWTPIDAIEAFGRGEFARWSTQSAAIRDGLLVVLLKADGTQRVASFVKDGVRVDISRNLDTTFYDAETGDYLGGSVGNVFDGPVRNVGASFELLDESGEVRVSVSVDEATSAVTDVVDGPDQWAIATTSDLETWEVTDVTELVPAPRAAGLRVDVIAGRPTATLVTLGLAGPTGEYLVIRTGPS